LLFLLEGAFAQTSDLSMYYRLMEQGESYFIEKQYQAAYRKYSAANVCDVKYRLKLKSEEKMNETLDVWTSTLIEQERIAKEQEKIAKEQEEKAIAEKDTADHKSKISEKDAIVIRSFLLEELALDAKEKGKEKEAYSAAFQARYLIENYNTKLNELKKKKLVSFTDTVKVPPKVYSTLNNLTFHHTKQQGQLSKKGIIAIRFAKDAENFVTIDRDKTLKVWDSNLKTKFEQQLEDFYSSVDISDAGNLVLALTKEGKAIIYDIDKQSVVQIAEQQQFTKGKFYYKDKLINSLIFSKDGFVRNYDKDGKQLNISEKINELVHDITILKEDKALLHTLSSIYIFNLEKFTIQDTLTKNNQLIYDTYLSDEQQRLVTVFQDGATVWNLSNLDSSDLSNLPDSVSFYQRNKANALEKLIVPNFGYGDLALAQNANLIYNLTTEELTPINAIYSKGEADFTQIFSTRRQIVQAKELILITSSKDGTIKLWSAGNKMLMNIELEGPVEDVKIFHNKFIAYTSDGFLYSIPFPENISTLTITEWVKK